MEQAHFSETIGNLERQYFELHHSAKQAEAELSSGNTERAADLRARLEAAEREKRAILSRIAQLEDGLLDDE